jgi:hypothetical protein
MKTPPKRTLKYGRIGSEFLWLLGIPVPLLMVFFLLRGGM